MRKKVRRYGALALLAAVGAFLLALTAPASAASQRVNGSDGRYRLSFAADLVNHWDDRATVVAARTQGAVDPDMLNLLYLGPGDAGILVYGLFQGALTSSDLTPDELMARTLLLGRSAVGTGRLRHRQLGEDRFVLMMVNQQDGHQYYERCLMRLSEAGLDTVCAVSETLLDVLTLNAIINSIEFEP